METVDKEAGTCGADFFPVCRWGKVVIDLEVS